MKPKKGETKRFVRSLIGTTNQRCIAWPYGKAGNGYGCIRVGKTQMTVARYVCMLVHGSPPPGPMHAAHSCGRGADGCVNPNHIRWASPQENGLDMVKHGSSRGARNGRARLMPVDVIFMRELWRNGWMFKDLAKLWGVHHNTSRLACIGESWGHLP